ncbi:MULTISPECIES: riboflavin biosynthesis protein RibF [unclassified Ruminococcus]|uniref:riboflavin biosynthesis protein RibF n=1 Tax=unclassified Ruminococcus TaxID=2608920 RepID=UPI00210D585B|nr:MULTISPECIES: riboflavin biosynthesis protein RibF [unclassified Ruminococcus]MCQ4023095.1 riboflavin biosynthesis protein RibF [Ruminococcus sp. zg-924]MCQ4115532.1 riboflavin biosynthesis protein RibF [Ruminococcus sp. zg-921]
MKIYQNIERSDGELSLALGFFDGLHRGHQSVINAAVEQKNCGLIPAMLTFKESPQRLISKRAVPRLMTRQSRYELLESLGIEVLYELDFESIRNISPQDFVQNILCKALGAKKVFCGFNYHFGKAGAGDEKMLHTLCANNSIEAVTLPPVIFGSEAISSTRIRNALASGEVEKANKMLGRRFSFDFTVSHGNELGRKMETPTINQPIPCDFILPRFGVYATYATIDGITQKAVTNIGVKPTVGSPCPLSETWILDREIGSLYGCRPKIELVQFIRPEQKFSGITQLQAAILKDGQTAKNIFERADTSL